MKRPDQYATM